MQQFNFPTLIYYGEGALQQFIDILAEQNYQKILIVTDKTLVDLGIIQLLTTPLDHHKIDYALFSDSHPNPIEDDVVEGKQVFLKHQCDCIVAMGGGAPMDVAKAIKVLATHPEPLGQYDENKGGDALINQPMPPLYAIPTTAGTGSEVGRSGVIIIKETGKKTIIFHPDLLPKIAVLEPAVTLKLPPSITAATGIDAFTHCLEAYFSPLFHPMAEGIAIEGMKLIIENLPIATQHSENIEARSKMLLAATMGATAFQKGLGMIHSMAHPLSAEFDTHHGLANALLLPYASQYLEQQPLTDSNQKKLAVVNQLFHDAGLGKPQLSETLHQFVEALGITLGLCDHGIPEHAFEKLSQLALQDPCHLTNMMPVTQTDFLNVFKAAA